MSLKKDNGMNFNSYRGCIEQWKVDLIVYRAKAFGFQEDEIMDIQQDLVLKLMKFKYDPQKSNDAQESTVLQTVIDNELKMRHRSMQCRKDHTEALRLVKEYSEISSDTDLTIDIQDAISSLPPMEQKICVALSKNWGVADIADLLNVGRTTVYRRIQKIRDHFQGLGLDQYLGNNHE
jgi:RNA polymerase sigma factor (sigma-70 family)